MPKQIASQYKVVVMGDNSHIGTSCLANRLTRNKFSEHYAATIGVEYSSFLINSLPGALWTMSGAARYHGLRSMYLKSVNMVLYCVDLSNLADASIEKIKQDISDIKQQTPRAYVILVATKSDLYSGNRQEDLNDLSQQVGSDACVVTSAKTEAGIDDLKNLIVCRAQNGQRQTLLSPNTREFMVRSVAEDLSLTTEQQTNLIAALGAFECEIAQGGTPVNEATQTFVTDCHRILEGTHPNIMAAVHTFAAAVVVAGVIALAGIAFGVAVLPLSITSGIGGAVTAGLTLNSIFRDRSHKNLAIDQWSQTVLGSKTAPVVS